MYMYFHIHIHTYIRTHTHPDSITVSLKVKFKKSFPFERIFGRFNVLENVRLSTRCPKNSLMQKSVRKCICVKSYVYNNIYTCVRACFYFES